MTALLATSLFAAARLRPDAAVDRATTAISVAPTTVGVPTTTAVTVPPPPPPLVVQHTAAGTVRQRTLLVDLDGRSRELRTPEPIYDASWSPDRTRLVVAIGSGRYSDCFRLAVMAADGTGLTPITEGCDQQPAWSPDGTLIAFSSFQFQTVTYYPSYAIAVVRPDGTDLRVLTTPVDHPAHAESYTVQRGIGDHAPTWSPDSRTIAFARERTQVDPGLYAVGVAGGDEQHLGGKPEAAGPLFDPDWSPDGATIAAVRHAVDGRSQDIVLFRTDGTLVGQLTTTPPPPRLILNANSGYPGNFTPTFSPDGSLIAFRSNRDHRSPREPQWWNFDLYVMRPDGSDVRRITFHPLPPEPSIQPESYFVLDW